ncbi:hypothetical protein Tco_0582046 [Tanacetum coccineum]
MSTPVFVDPEVSTQVNGAQSSRVPVPLPKDPYEAIRQAYLDETNTESEPFEGPIDTETHESTLTVAPPTSLPESTPPTLVPILRRTARMAVRVPHAMSSGLSANMAEVAAMSKSAFRKRFRSSYESSPSSSPPDLPSRKRYQGTSELVEDSEEDDDEEDEKIEESLDSESVSEDTEDEGPTAGDESLAAGDKGPGMDDESHGFDDESRGLDNEGHSVESDGFGLEEEEEAVPGGQQQAAPVVGTAVTPPVQTLPSPEWTFGSLLISPSYSVVPSPMISQTVPSPVATPATAETEGFLTEPGAQVDMQGGLIRDHAVQLEELSPALFKRYQFWSLEYEQERVAVTFGAIWRPVLALESWAGQTDAHRAALWHAISDMHGENRDLWLQLTKERHARLELAEVVDSMRRGQEPRGDA